MNNQTTLLPCPFCGGTDVRFYPSSMRDGLGDLVLCANKGCEAEMGGDTQAEAIARWNRRVTPARTNQRGVVTYGY